VSPAGSKSFAANSPGGRAAGQRKTRHAAERMRDVRQAFLHAGHALDPHLAVQKFEIVG